MSRIAQRLVLGTLIVTGMVSRLAADTADDLLESAAAALKKDQTAEALSLASKAIEADPKSPKPYLFRGHIQEALQHHAEAIADFDRAIKLDPKAAEAYNHRGMEQFKLAHFAESLADFDRYLELMPTERNGHWQRGITCYYLGKFKEGKEQFEGYEKVDTNDVENAVWQFLCNARLVGVEKARGEMLKIGTDKRVPLMQVYALYGGKATPENVLSAAREGSPSPEELKRRLFYAYLYLGLYYDATGDKEHALEAMKKAAEDYKLPGYMWDVARVHLDVLRKAAK